jgi:hypothetical protein
MFIYLFSAWLGLSWLQICTVLTEGEARVDPDHDADYGEDAARKVFQVRLHCIVLYCIVLTAQ